MLNVVNGFVYIDIIWSNMEIDFIIVISSVGIYSVIVIDLNGCMGIVIFEVEEVALLDVFIFGVISYCIGISMIFMVSLAGFLYEWFNGVIILIVEIIIFGIVFVMVINVLGC